MTMGLQLGLLTILVVICSSVASPQARFLDKNDPQESSKPPVLCDEAKMRCALRQGCSKALRVYMLDCADLMAGKETTCNEYCKSALIALLSTEEGSELMNCECSDAYCREVSERVNACRDEVLAATAEGVKISCGMAHLICLADSQCTLALSFYESRCPRMFNGKSCTPRCNNSIAVLRRQKQAHRLETCECDNTEAFDCAGIKKNMAQLCFHQYDDSKQQEEEELTNEIDSFTENIVPNITVSATCNLEIKKVLIAAGFVVAHVVRWII